MADTLLRETRQAVRGLLRRPSLTVPALLTLALGIGANGAVFSALNSMVLRPLPYAAPDALVTIWPQHFFGNRDIDYLRRNLKSIGEVASVSPGWLMALTGVEQATEVDAARVSGNLFETLGVRPHLGRTFTSDAERAPVPAVVVLSHDFWRTQFNGDPDIVGRSITLNQESFEIIGVMPRGFHIVDAESDLWYPLPMDPTEAFWQGAITLALGRLAPGASTAQADAELKGVVRRMVAEFAQPAATASDASVVGLKADIIGPMRLMIVVLFVAVLFILAIAAANVANLLLVRATERRTEFAVRTSLGASRFALLRQLALESLVLSTLGGLVGLALALAGVRALRAMLPPETPRLQELSVDARVVGFCVLISVLVGLLATLAPAFLTSAQRLSGYLRAGRTTTGSANRTRAALIVIEVALAVVLVSGATLMLRTLAYLHRVDPGFRTSHLLTMRVQPSQIRNADQLRAYWRDLLPRLSALPGVEAAGTVLHLPMGGRRWNAAIDLEGQTLPPDATRPHSAWQSVGGDYFDAMGIQMLAGRMFRPDDHESAPRVVVVNDVLARLLWPGRDPLGQRLRAGRATNNELATVIGVVRAVRHDSLSTTPGPELYLHFPQTIVWATSVVLRTRVEPGQLAATVRETIWSLSRDVPITHMRSIDEVLAQSTTRRRVIMTLLGTFAGIGVLLGLVGIYGLVAHTVRQRTREIGIRMALGATPRDVLTLMTTIGLQWASLGVLVGTAAALALTRYIRGLMFGVTPHDPLTFALVPVLLLACACLAALVPARRAAAANPASILQE